MEAEVLQRMRETAMTDSSNGQWEREERERRREERKRKQRRQRRIFFIWQGAFAAAAVLLFFQIRTWLGDMKDGGRQAFLPEATEQFTVSQDSMQGSGNTAMDYVGFCGLDEVEKPVKRNEKEVLQKLSELSEENEIIRGIYEEAEAFPQKYPENMLEALANNPEMADFVERYPGAEKAAAGGLTEVEFSQEYPLFLQWDPRWGYAPYGDDSNIGLAGCGPTSLSMVLYYLTGDETLTPDAVADYSMENGFYMSGTGTAWALMEELPAKYGIRVSYPGIGESRMKEALDKGSMLICAMRPGDFTAAGHFIVIYGYDKTGFFVNDPNCVARSRKSWTFAELKNQIKNLWAFSGGKMVVK